MVAGADRAARARADGAPRSARGPGWWRPSPASGLMVGAAMFSAISYVPLLVQEGLGGTAVEAGRALTPLVLGWVVISVIAGRLVHRIGYRPMVLGGLSAVTPRLHRTGRHHRGDARLGASGGSHPDGHGDGDGDAVTGPRHAERGRAAASRGSQRRSASSRAASVGRWASPCSVRSSRRRRLERRPGAGPDARSDSPGLRADGPPSPDSRCSRPLRMPGGRAHELVHPDHAPQPARGENPASHRERRGRRAG